MFTKELDYRQTVEAQHVMCLFISGLGIACGIHPGKKLTQKELEILWIDRWAHYMLTKTNN